jgi:hypothetical protein
MNGVALSFSRDASICQQGTCVSNAQTGLLKKISWLLQKS